MHGDGGGGCWLGRRKVWGSILLCWLTLLCRIIYRILGGGFLILTMVIRFVGRIVISQLMMNRCLMVFITTSGISWFPPKCLSLLGDYCKIEFQQDQIWCLDMLFNLLIICASVGTVTWRRQIIYLLVAICLVPHLSLAWHFFCVFRVVTRSLYSVYSYGGYAKILSFLL